MFLFVNGHNQSNRLIHQQQTEKGRRCNYQKLSLRPVQRQWLRLLDYNQAKLKL